MARLTLHKTSFTAGEISSRLLGRGDLTAFENGAAKLRNVFIHPTGGVSRRPGLRYLDTHYHTKNTTPPWARNRTPTTDIGNHRFYNNIE
jgi:hypothetical protein